MNDQKNGPIVTSKEERMDETRETTGEDLKFNAEKDSFELDVPTEEGDEYQHEDPYQTAAPSGSDNNSTWDEENPTAQNEYRQQADDALKSINEPGLTREDGEAIQLSDREEQQAEAVDDNRADVDDEGYPLNDDVGGPDNPIVDPPREDPDQDDEDLELPAEEDPLWEEEDIDDDLEDDPTIEPEPVDERDPLGDKQIQSDDPSTQNG